MLIYEQSFETIISRPKVPKQIGFYESKSEMENECYLVKW